MALWRGVVCKQIGAKWCPANLTFRSIYGYYPEMVTRLLTRTTAVTASLLMLASAVVSLTPPDTASAAQPVSTLRSLHLSALASGGAGNVDFTGGRTVTDPAKPDETATLDVSDENASTGKFSGVITPPADATGAFAEPFQLHDGQVTGDRFSFSLERTGIGGTGPDDRNATYTASWTGTVKGNTASGSIDAKTVPGTLLNPDGFAGMRSFSARRPSSVNTSPGTGPAAGGVIVQVTGSGLDSAVTANITDADGKVLASVPVNGASGSGFSFTAPDLTAALHDADNAATAAGSPISQLALQVVPRDAQGQFVSAPADYAISAPVVGTTTPSEIAVGGGQSVVVKGSYFEGASAVDFQLAGSSTIVSASATVVSDHEIRFTSPDLQKCFPPASAGASAQAAQMTLDMYVRVNVTQAFGSLIYSNSKPFVVDNLKVDKVLPSEGPLVGGDSVQVVGVGFTNATEVDMVATSAPAGKTPRTLSIPISPSNDNSFSFTVPNNTAYASGSPASASYDLVVVATISGQRETTAISSADRYDYKGPVVSSISAGATAVHAAGGTPIVVNGEYFQGATKVVLKTFGASNVDVTPSSVSSKSIAFTLPDMKATLKSLGEKSAKFQIIVEIPIDGTSFSFIDSVSGSASTLTVGS